MTSRTEHLYLLMVYTSYLISFLVWFKSPRESNSIISLGDLSIATIIMCSEQSFLLYCIFDFNRKFHIHSFEQALYEALMKQEELLAYIDSQEDAKFRVSEVDAQLS